MSVPEGGSTKAPWHRSEYLALAALMAVALAINLWMYNLLWLWYSAAGSVMLGIVMWADHRFSLALPRRTLMWAGVPLAMHYIGGSLSGMHQWGANGLYYVFPWWDNTVHFLGCGAVAVMMMEVLRQPVPAVRWRIPLAAACASVFGMAIEMYEFVNFAWFGTIDQGYYTNTMLDLYYNVLGAGVFALSYGRPTARGP